MSLNAVGRSHNDNVRVDKVGKAKSFSSKKTFWADDFHEKGNNMHALWEH